MKTEPTESLKYADKELSDIKIVYIGATKDSKIFKHKDLVCAFEQGQSSPKIKQLEWVEVWEGYEDAKTPFGHYVVRPAIDNKTFLMIDMRKGIQPYLTLNEAKAAAQIDFEKRIKECLE